MLVGRRRVLAAALVATALVAAIAGGAPAQAAPKPTQGLIFATGGCGNTIAIRAIDYSGKVTGVRTMVRARGNVQLIPYDISTKPNVFLYGAYNCDTKTYRLYSQRVAASPTPSVLLDPGPGITLIDVTWDLARDQALALVRDDSFNYAVLLNSPSGWAPIWKASQPQLGDIYLQGIQSLTGREFKIYGAQALGSGKWQTWRVDGAGNTSAELSGTTGLQAIASTTLLTATAYMGPGGTWICDWHAFGTVEAAAAQGKCTAVPNGGASDGAFLYASGNADKYWLVLEPSTVPATAKKSKVTCTGGDLFSCGTPSAQSAVSAPSLYGQDLLSTTLFDINFAKIGATRVG